MVKVDLITGFLGSGKTTFIKKYARYLMEQGQNIGILENDFGAINVDMMLLRELEGENCELEMLQKTFQNKTDRNGNVWLRQSSDRTVRNLRCR